MTESTKRNEVLEFNRTQKPLLIEAIKRYQAEFTEEEEVEQILGFIGSTDNLFGRDSKIGHITCGAWIVDSNLANVILVRHRRLGRWIQPGGHIEPMETPFAGALREAMEETGLEKLVLWRDGLFNLSVHLFPEGKDGPAHLHYDFRYLFFAPKTSRIIATDETDGVAWVPLDKISSYTGEATILAMAEKTKKLIQSGEIIDPDVGRRG